MLAFEVAKGLEKLGETIQICGILDMPPQANQYFQGVSWCRLFLTLLSYIGLLTDEQEYELNEEFRLLPKDEITKRVMASVNHAQLEKLDLGTSKLHLWTDITDSILSLSHDYCPSGSVACLDVFYAAPGYRISLNKDRQSWFDEDISQWDKFSRSPVRYHGCPGTHHTMLNAEYVFDFQKLLKAAMKAREVA
jgi:thioesterase domain-containing protein